MDDKGQVGDESLTEREREILALIADDLTNQQIADWLFLSLNTVKWYNSQIYSKLGVSNREDAVEQATLLGLLDSASDVPQPLVRHNLPLQITPFIGRQRELATMRTTQSVTGWPSISQAARNYTLGGCWRSVAHSSAIRLHN